MEWHIMHDSQDINYRNPFGAIESGEKVDVIIKAPEASEVKMIIFKDKGLEEVIEMEREEEVFKGSLNTKEYVGIVYYHFKILLRDGNQIYYGNNIERLGGLGMVYTYNPSSFQITVYKPYDVPQWFKEGIVYQIFVDSFYNGNEDGKVLNPKRNSLIYGSWYDEPMYIKDHEGRIIRWAFYGGNLKGVIKKLPYIKSLGATIIYLNPIFEAGSPHKYDTGNYEKIDSMFGDEETFKNLCSESNKLGIKIILDGVFSHTGADSMYFNKYKTYENIGAYNSQASKYYNWYKFKEYPNNYECWWGINALPNVYEMNEGYLDYIVRGEKSIVDKWMKLGASGWRLDVADELPDQFIKILKTRMREIDKNSVLLGEVWEDASNKVSYGERRNYVLGDELDSVTNYPLRNIILDFLKGYIDGRNVKRKITSLYENYPREFFYSCLNLLGSHDTERIMTTLSGIGREEKHTIALVKLARLFQLTLPGVPCIYYGDETGLRGGKDPENRKAYPWNFENIGLINHYREIINIRKREKVIISGSLKFLQWDNDYIIYVRQYGNEKVYVGINRSLIDSHYIKMDKGIKNLEVIYGETEIDTNGGFILKPLEGIILKCYDN